MSDEYKEDGQQQQEEEDGKRYMRNLPKDVNQPTRST